MTRDEAIQRLRAAFQVRFGYSWTVSDEIIASTWFTSIRALMDADKPLPGTVDPDLLLARKIVADECERDRLSSMVAHIRAGEHDDWTPVRATLAGIRAGKAMR